jgi:hypothetical protein
MLVKSVLYEQLAALTRLLLFVVGQPKTPGLSWRDLSPKVLIECCKVSIRRRDLFMEISTSVGTFQPLLPSRVDLID